MVNPVVLVELQESSASAAEPGGFPVAGRANSIATGIDTRQGWIVKRGFARSVILAAKSHKRRKK
jgi:hypothetical protein